MQKLIWQNSKGEEINLTSGHYGITNWQGFSEVSLNVQSQTVPFQDGSVYLDALLDERELSVTLAIQDNNDLELRYQLRRELIHALNPKLNEGYLIYTNDFISKRIKCVSNVPVFENHNSNDTGTPKASLTWTACEPYWEDLEETVVNLKINEVKTLNNEGDIPAQMEIDLFTDNAVNPLIERMSDGNKIEYNGTLNKNLHINTNIGEKKVFNEDLEFNIANYNGSIKGVCYSIEKGLFVGVSQGGVIYTSYDGEEWECRSVINNDLNAVCYGNGLFVAVGKSGTILTSENGFDWVSQNNNVPKALYSVCYGNGKYVAIGDEGTITTSINGSSWIERTSGTSNTLYGICYANDLFIAVGEGGMILTSTDTETWTSRTSGTSNDLKSVCYSNNLFVAVGNNGSLISSSDGVNWNTVQNNMNNINLRTIIYIERLSLYITGGEEGTLYACQNIYDGYWVLGRLEYDNINCFAYSEYKIICVCDTLYFSSNKFISDDGTEWTRISENFERDLLDVIYIEEKKLFVAVGRGTNLIISSNGKKWEKIEKPTSKALYAIVYSNQKFIMVGEEGNIFITDNLINWENPSSGTSDILYSICYGNGIYVAVGEGGMILTSTDTETWTSRTSGTSNDLKSVTYSQDKGMFIAVGDNGTILRSWDCINWYPSDMMINYNLTKIIYADELFVIVGDYNSLYSLDGISWNTQSSAYDFENNSVTFSETLHQFLSVGQNNIINQSYDGMNWNRFSFNGNINFKGIANSDLMNIIVIVGDIGAIIYSSFSQGENQIQNIDANSDMNLNIPVGENKFRVIRSAGNVNARIKYRQKYIGV